MKLLFYFFRICDTEGMKISSHFSEKIVFANSDESRFIQMDSIAMETTSTQIAIISYNIKVHIL